MSRRPSPTWVLALLALCEVFFAGCQGTPAGGSAEPTPFAPTLIRQAGGEELLKLSPGQIPGMTIVTVHQVPLPSVLETTGAVAFDDRRVSTIVSRVNGRIEDTRVSLWDRVGRGEPIVSLYSPDFITAEAEYLQAVETSRLSSALTTGGGSDKFAKALVGAARRKLELLGMPEGDIDSLKTPGPTVWMRAPISGTVVEKRALRGAAVAPGDVLFSLGTLDEVWITADIYEDELARVRDGQSLEAVTSAYPDQVFHGTIARISPNIDPTTHTAQLRCQVRNPGAKLKPQMLARVRIVTRPGMALVAPQEALIFETDSYYAYVEVAPGLIGRRKVLIGTWNEKGYARIVSGLGAGDRIVGAETIQVNALWHEAHGESS